MEVPTTLEPQLRNVTRTGLPLRTFAEDLVRETLLMGRYGVLLDFPAPTVLPSGQILSPPPVRGPTGFPMPLKKLSTGTASSVKARSIWT